MSVRTLEQKAITAASDWGRTALGVWPRVRTAAMWIAFTIGYCALDRLDMMRFPVTSGLPLSDLAGGLAMALLINQGPRLFALVFAADLLSNALAPGAHPPIAAFVCSAAAVAGCYALAAIYLRRFSIAAPQSQRDLFRLIIVAALATLARATGDLLVMSQWGGLTEPAYLSIFARSWAGGFIGVMLMTPLVAGLAAARTWPNRRAIGEFVLQMALLGLVLALVFPSQQSDQFRYFYLLFLPQIWIAVRFGVTGATVGNFAVQLGLIAYFLIRPEPEETMFNYDIRLVALTLSTLFLGCAVSERRHAEAVLRQRQEELARVSRLSLAGELAAALAHQLNQPLLATIAFTRAAQRFMGAQAGGAQTGGADTGRDEASQAMDEAVIQAERAGKIVRALRSFIGKGETDRRPHALASLARDAITLAEPECARLGIRIVTAIDRSLPEVQVDPVQIQQVLLNLVQNAVDALGRTDVSAKVILLSARQSSEREIEVEVRDTGPGISDEIESRLFEPFSSNKGQGMGLGLVICRGIIESHGGRLWLEHNQPGRCVFRFNLLIARERNKVTVP
jgi:two-component system sensor kinase FixL